MGGLSRCARFIHAEHDRTGLLGRVQVKADDGAHVAALVWRKVRAAVSLRSALDKERVGGELEVLLCKCGLRPKARQMRTMAFWLSPLAAAIA